MDYFYRFSVQRYVSFVLKQDSVYLVLGDRFVDYVKELFAENVIQRYTYHLTYFRSNSITIYNYLTSLLFKIV